MEHKNIIDNVLFNFFLDMRKKDIDKRQRAVLLAKYLKDNKMSQRELGKELGIPHSTIQDWLMINRISEEQYQQYLDDGLTETDIYRMLRNNKKAEEKDYDLCVLHQEIKVTTSKFKKLINYGKNLDEETLSEIKELINVLNRIVLHKERMF